MIDLSGIHLSVGEHQYPAEEKCLLEWAAHLAGEVHSDRPSCVPPVLAAVGRCINDLVGDDIRQRLVVLLPALIRADPRQATESVRQSMVLDWLIRHWAPKWLAAAGLTVIKTHKGWVYLMERLIDGRWPE